MTVSRYTCIFLYAKRSISQLMGHEWLDFVHRNAAINLGDRIKENTQPAGRTATKTTRLAVSSFILLFLGERRGESMSLAVNGLRLPGATLFILLYPAATH